MSKTRFATLSSVILAVWSFASFAHAQATRTWVSGVGDDVNPCSRTAPCKTFAGAISKTATGGEIDTLDPGGFGAVTITKAITIDGTAGLGGVLAAGTNGVIVNAPSTDTVILRNLDINGVGTGINAIRILSAGDVRIEHCKIFGFTNRGISDERTSGRLVVTDTVVSNSGQTGIAAAAASASTLKVTMDRVRMEGNGNAGLALSRGAKATVSRSVVSGNANYGFYADGVSGNSEMNLDDCVSSGNAIGISSQSGATIRMSNTTVTANGTGISAVGGTILSYGTNRIDGNTVGNGPATSGVAQQ